MITSLKSGDAKYKPQIIIPKSKLRWLLSFPDDVSSVQAAHYDTLQGEYNFTDPYILKNPFHEHVVHKNLHRNLIGLLPGIQKEVQQTIDESWGTDTENYKEIPLLSNMMHTIARASNYMFVGETLCRQPEYLKILSNFTNSIIRGTSIIPLFPAFSRPILGHIITLPNRYYWRQAKKYTVPLIVERKQNMLRKAQDPDFKYEPPNDYITWHIRTAMEEGRTVELETDMFSRYLMPINFAAIHTTSFTMTSFLFDVFGSDPAKGYVESLREEVERVFRKNDGQWNKTSLGKLYRLDSALRESMRFSPFMTRGVQRKIIAPQGITDPEDGFTIPQGGFVSTDVWSMFHDSDVYPNADVFDPFRFSRPQEEAEKRIAAGEKLNDKEVLKLKQQMMVATSENFLPFGHGKHACPGRFFVSNEIKMFIAYMLMNYEIEHFAGGRPKNHWFGQAVIPSPKTALRVKRRVGTT